MTGRQRLALLLAMDAVLIAAAFMLGYVIRFEGVVPPDRIAECGRWVPLLLAIRLPLHALFRLHRWSFRLSGFPEAVRLVTTSVIGSVTFAAALFFLQRQVQDLSLGPPRSVIVIEMLITTGLLALMRFSPRFAYTWSADRRRRQAGARVRAVVVGAGSAGELLLRDLNRSHEHRYDVVGFVDDDPGKLWTSIGGRPVLGSLDDLPRVARQRNVREVLFAVPRLPPGRLREVLGRCESLRLAYKILPVSFAYLNDRVSAAMLQELQADDLLRRPAVTFESHPAVALVEGRRLMVTGAGGSIGSEICRQAAARRPSSLVLVDQDENGLYLLARALEREHPRLRLAVEVADIRDRRRMTALGHEHRPEYLFHAAAHKHVPLMETAPEEAVKTNVLGCLNVALMAQAVGTRRFVLISTDKAVRPTSVMGATKAVAERLVRHLGTRSGTSFTAVRFGNVLGSSGSVVPLFKQQIAAGGPVTVTHPDCRRYFMTIREAVGLVLVSGLAGYGDLCILEMGEPIRILDLARLMVTLAGFVPDEEIPIVFTGLRPGDRLEEDLMTADELRGSRLVQPEVRVVETRPPALDFLEEVGRLRDLASRGERAALVGALREQVPGYAPSVRWQAVADGAARTATALP